MSRAWLKSQVFIEVRKDKKVSSWSFEGSCLQFHNPVAIAKGFHLFPCRTQQLSPYTPKVLDWKRSGRIGSCRLDWHLTCLVQWGVFLMSGCILEIGLACLSLSRFLLLSFFIRGISVLFIPIRIDGLLAVPIPWAYLPKDHPFSAAEIFLFGGFFAAMRELMVALGDDFFYRLLLYKERHGDGGFLWRDE